MYGIKWNSVTLDIDRYLLINGSRNPRSMSTQETGNTCYFQVYLFAVLCKVCAPTVGRAGAVELQNIDKLEEITVTISRFLLGERTLVIGFQRLSLVSSLRFGAA